VLATAGSPTDSFHSTARLGCDGLHHGVGDVAPLVRSSRGRSTSGAGDMSGPYVAVAAFCDQVLQGMDGATLGRQTIDAMFEGAA